MLEKEQPSLVLLDLMMPEMDGFEFVERIRRDARWTSLPVVIVTAKDVTDEDRERLNGSVQQILMRNRISHEELVSQLRDCVDRGSRPEASSHSGVTHA